MTLSGNRGRWKAEHTGVQSVRGLAQHFLLLVRDCHVGGARFCIPRAVNARLHPHRTYVQYLILDSTSRAVERLLMSCPRISFAESRQMIPSRVCEPSEEDAQKLSQRRELA